METNGSGKPAVPEKERRAPAPGEAVFTSVLCLAGALCLTRAVKLWNALPEPRVASAAALPLGASALWTLLSLISLLEVIQKQKAAAEKKPLAERTGEALRYAFPKTVFVISAVFIAYGVSLLFGLSFYTVTPLFLFLSMSYLNRGKPVQNVIRTAVCMAVIVLVFRLLFSIVLP